METCYVGASVLHLLHQCRVFSQTCCMFEEPLVYRAQQHGQREGRMALTDVFNPLHSMLLCICVLICKPCLKLLLVYETKTIYVR